MRSSLTNCIVKQADVSDILSASSGVEPNSLTNCDAKGFEVRLILLAEARDGSVGVVHLQTTT